MHRPPIQRKRMRALRWNQRNERNPFREKYLAPLHREVFHLNVAGIVWVVDFTETIDGRPGLVVQPRSFLLCRVMSAPKAHGASAHGGCRRFAPHERHFASFGGSLGGTVREGVRWTSSIGQESG